MLNDIENNLENDQDEDDAYIFSLQDECDQDINRLTEEIAAATTRSQELGDELKQKIPIRDQKINESEEKTKFLNTITEEIDTLDG